MSTRDKIKAAAELIAGAALIYGAFKLTMILILIFTP